MLKKHKYLGVPVNIFNEQGKIDLVAEYESSFTNGTTSKGKYLAQC